MRRGATQRRLVVVGNGMAGMRTVEELLALTPDQYQITLFGAEPWGNYNRILLSPLLAGEKSQPEIMLHDLDWYKARGLKLKAGVSAVAIDRGARTVTGDDGEVVPYDRLLLATGSQPIVLPLPGCDLDGVFAFRDLYDAHGLIERARQPGRAVVIGGGLLGLEAASGLAKRGMAVTVVHLGDYLLDRQLDAPAARLLQAELGERGIAFCLATQTQAIRGEAGRVTGVVFADGRELVADLVVMAVGIRPNIALAQAAGLRCERGICVDDTLQTFDPAIYAVGECVQHRGKTYGLVAPLWEQAKVCAEHLAEVGQRRYKGSVLATRLKVSGVELFSAGDFLASAPGSEVLTYSDEGLGIYKKLVLRQGALTGAVLYGDARDGAWYFELIAHQIEVAAHRDELLFGRAAVAADSTLALAA